MGHGPIPRFELYNLRTALRRIATVGPEDAGEQRPRFSATLLVVSLRFKIFLSSNSGDMQCSPLVTGLDLTILLWVCGPPVTILDNVGPHQMSRLVAWPRGDISGYPEVKCGSI